MRYKRVRTHARKSGTTVEQGAFVDISRKLALGIGEERKIQLFLLRAEVVPANDNRAWRQSEIISSLKLANEWREIFSVAQRKGKPWSGEASSCPTEF
jgi:hypothetical protein